MRVYRELHEQEYKSECNFGQHHIVHVWAGKNIYDTGETWQDDPGYGPEHVVTSKIYSDRQGREYRALYPIDYAGKTSYIATVGKKRYWFYTRLGAGYNVDTLGRKI